MAKFNEPKKLPDDPFSLGVLLGTGGESPGLHRWDVESQQTQSLLTLASNESIYAVSLSPDGRCIVLGTKTGLIQGIDLDKDSGDWPPSQHAGTGILSICWVGECWFVTSTLSGLCQLWDFFSPTAVKTLTIGGALVVSFLKRDDELLGLSCDGEVLVWSLPDLVLRQIRLAPAPGPRWGLIGMIAWPSTDSLVWPGREGLLIQYDLQNGKDRTLMAHEGEFYALGCDDQNLYTVGWSDETLRVWSPSYEDSGQTYRVGPGAIALDVLGTDPLELLMVDQFGLPQIYRKDDAGDLRVAGQIPVPATRVILPPNVDQRRRYDQLRRKQKIENLASQIELQIQRQQWEGLEDLYRQLDQEGYRHYRLAYQAYQAKNQKDLIGEILAQGALVELLNTDPGLQMEDIRSDYVELLAKTWQLDMALDICGQTNPQKQGNHRQDKQKQLELLRDAQKAGRLVIASEFSLPELIAVARYFQRPLDGLWVVESWTSSPCRGQSISPQEVARVYETLRLQKAKESLPPARINEVLWVEEGRMETIPFLWVQIPAQGSVPGLGLGMKFSHDGLQSILTFVVLFQVCEFEESPTHLDSKFWDQKMETWQKIQQGHLSRPWLKVVSDFFTAAIRQLVTRAMGNPTF